MTTRSFLRTILTFAFAALAAAGLSGCNKADGGENGVIKITSSLPRQGSSAKQTTDMVYGIRMALDEVRWTILGKKIVYDDLDCSSPQRGGNWDPAIEAANAKKAAADKDCMVYLATFNSGAAKISIPITNAADLLMISPANTYPGLTKPGKGEPNEPDIYRQSGRINYFRVVPADDIQGAVGAQWAKKFDVSKVFVTHDRELYGKGIADVFKETAEKLGLEVVGYEGLDVKATNYKPLVAKMKGVGTELVYYGGITQNNAGQLAKDIRQGGLDVPLMVPDGCYEEAFIQAAGAENLNDKTYATFGGTPSANLAGKAREFVERFQAKYDGRMPEPYAVYAYEAARAALDAIRRAGKKDRSAITEACRNLKDYEGILGTWSFDENGDTTLTTMSGNVVRGGEWHFLDFFSAE